MIGVLCGGIAEAALPASGCVQMFRDPEDLRPCDTSFITKD
jgi:hypothetical protein